MKPTAESHPQPDLGADVLVVGGGLIGSALACALAGHGVSAICVESSDPAALVDQDHDGRSSAIARACQRALETIGVWRHMAADVQPILDIRITDGDSPFYLHYDHRDVGEAMGYMAENRVIRRGLFARFKELDTAALIAPHRLAAVTRDADWVHARLDDGRTIRAKLIVGADGRHSQTREDAGIRLRRGPAYNQVGVVLTVEHQHDHRGIAHERFLPAGPFAILPLPGGHRSSLVWTEREPLGWTILDLPDDQFHGELMERFGDFLGEVRIVSARFGYPLSARHAERYIDTRLALVGDAAHGMHPVAGQGMNFGLRDAAALTEKIVEAHRLGIDIGGARVLEGYQRWRRFDTLSMLAITDGITRLFSNNVKALRLARSMGLAIVDKLPGVKTVFMRHAMGDIGAAPKLMKGRAV